MIRQLGNSTIRQFDNSTIRQFDNSTIRRFDNEAIETVVIGIKDIIACILQHMFSAEADEKLH